MKTNRSSIFWGIALILGGIVFLASNYGLIPNWNNNPNFWIPALLVLSALFLLTFTLNGKHAWGWLFPASMCAGQAGTLYLAVTQVHSPVVAFPTLISVALPFLIGYLLDRSRTGLLIPAWIIASVAGMMFFVDSVQGEVIPLYVMMVAALPFLYGGLTNPTRRGLLIPGGILALVGLLPIMVTSLDDALVPSYVMFSVALPFIVTAAWSRKNWWAIIPSGIMLSIGAALIISGVTRGGDADVMMNTAGGDTRAAIMLGSMFLGFAITFGLLWLLRASAPTPWAIYPAAGLLLISVCSFAFGAEITNIVWPVAIIAAGALMLFRTMRPKHI